MAILKWGAENSRLQIYYSDCYENRQTEFEHWAVGRHFMVVRDLDQVVSGIKRCPRHSATTTNINFVKIS